MIYRFKISFDILAEAGISLSNLELEAVQFSTVLLKRNTLELTENQLATIKNKLATFFNNKFNLTTAKAELIEIIK